jgi:hypothetical protein
MGSLVGLEVRALGVDLFTSGELALVDAATFGQSTSCTAATAATDTATANDGRQSEGGEGAGG